MSITPLLRVSSPAPNATPSQTGDAKSITTSITTTEIPSPTHRIAARAYPHLLSYEELPEWAQDNEYIRHGYRPISGSAAASFRSLFYIHNESINIYTHLIPALAFIVGQVFSFFVFTAVACLSLSSCYHTLTNHSIGVDSIWLRMDFSGIILLTLGDFVSGIYMVFWCERMERIIYWVMILTLGVIDIFILVNPRFQRLSWRKFRVMCFVGTGLSGFAPLAHGIYLFGFSQMMKQSGMPYYLAEGALLALGALVYTTRFPECLNPGKFDLYGASHQIFHVLVVLATITQLVGILDAYGYNSNHRTCLAA